MATHYREQGSCHSITYHSRRTDLRGSERLLDLFPMSQVPDVTGDLLRRGAQASNSVGNVLVYLAAICLGGNAVAGREAELLAE